LVVYYRFYAEDGAIPSKTSASADEPFLGRVKADSVAPPHTVASIKRCLARYENVKDTARTSLFLTSSSKSPLGNARRARILKPGHGRLDKYNDMGLSPQSPLALVAHVFESEHSGMESSELANRSVHAPETRYCTSNAYCSLYNHVNVVTVYYRLYTADGDVPSKVSIDPDNPSLGRISAHSVAPCHTPTSIKRCISRVERNPALRNATLFADITCDTPMKDIHIPILDGVCPGLTQSMPMAIVEKWVFRHCLPSPYLCLVMW
jgi:hypothetical protein